MTGRPIGPGDDVDAWCTRCKMNLNHRVIATVGSDIRRVQCLTCGSDHKYYPPKDMDSTPRKKRSSSASTATTSRTAPAKGSARARGEWTTFMKEMDPTVPPRPYKISEDYKAGEYIEHSALGTGRVVDVLGSERIEVAFEDGRRILVCNRQT